ncbi:MAG: DUF4831 family protein [Alistipes sp.]|nr:DUF4831 family protein [Candidatus Alistipes equi]
MKKIAILALLVMVFQTVFSQEISRVGVTYENGEIKILNPKTELYVVITVEKNEFTPGVYARYAQKYLGTRASLAERKEYKIVSSTISTSLLVEEDNVVSTPKFKSPLAENKIEARPMGVEEQAKYTADLIFSLRKHRLDLITGETGEHVFGAGLKAAIDEISRLEQEYLQMFYGTENISVESRLFRITPKSTEKDYMVCRFNLFGGIMPLDDLSSDAIMLHMEPSPVDRTPFRIATQKDKMKEEIVVSAKTECTLLLSDKQLSQANLDIFQFGEKIMIVKPQ